MLTSMNSNNDTLNSQINDLVLEYMTACNEGKHADAEQLLFKIKQLRRLCNETS